MSDMSITVIYHATSVTVLYDKVDLFSCKFLSVLQYFT